MQRKIFSVLGVMPEPGGYAAAKFSRTPTYKSYQDWVLELTQEGAEKFYNSMYFEYGHSSIADLAHLMVIFENISMPARHILLDDQLIDAQSRSTRYVDYSRAVFIIPPEIKDDQEILDLFNGTIKAMVGLYSQIIEEVSALYAQKYCQERPADMDDDRYCRTMKARAIDVARYTLPCASPKSMGVIASGRTWERIICKFLSSPLLECQEIGRELQEAICQNEAFNASVIKINSLPWLTDEQKADIKKLIAGNNVALPTLVKYAARKDYPCNVYLQIKNLLKIKEKPNGKRGVEMFERVDPETDFVTSLLYKATPYSYGQILKTIKQDKKLRKKIIDLAFTCRSDHDQVAREASTQTLVFDICMDVGGFRDLHRHRNCIHVLKPVTGDYGYDMPKEIKEINLEKEYKKLMVKVWGTYKKIERKYPGVGEYILPQATRRRFLMKMSPWELQYVTELRTRPQGHFSYREIAYLMWQKFNRKHPDWGKHIKVTSPDKVDFFKR